MDRKFVATSLVFVLAGLCLGIFMAATKNHQQLVAHAHIMLIGFLLSFVYGLMHKLWISCNDSKLAVVQFYVHVAGAIGVSIGLFLLYGEFVAEAVIGPMLGVFSFLVLLGAILMSVLFMKSCKKA